MSADDIAELDRLHAEEFKTRPKDMSDEDWNEANMLFAKGGDNLFAGTVAGLGQDEQGNITFDPEKFVLGLGGYTAVKAALKNKQVQGVLREYAAKAIDDIEETMVKAAGGGIPTKSTRADKELAEFVDASVKKHAKELEPSDSVFEYLRTTKNGTIYSPELKKEIDTARIINHFADKATISESTGELIGEGADRLKYINYMVDAVREPLFVAKDGDKYHFFKSFLVKNPKGEDKHLRYAVVTLDKAGEVIGITSHLMKNNDVKNLLKKSDEVIGGGSYPDFVPPVHLMSGATDESMAQKGLKKDKWNKNLLHANAGESLAGGFGGGSETIASQRDWNEDGKVDGADVLYGAVAGALGLKTSLGGLKRVNPKAYNAIMGASETFPAMAKNNPKLLTELHQNGKANSINMFAGTKAIKADVGKLDDAMKLVNDGASEADVWKKTGWFKGDDGKWRFEIDDSGSKILSKDELDELAKKDPYEMVELPLSQVFKHDELFTSYPQLNDIKVNWEYSKAKGFEDEKNIYYGANYDPQEKLITVGNGLDDKQIKSSLLHEVQHAVQDIESFAMGGSTKSKEYHLLHGEAEARLTQKRAIDGYEKFPYDDLDVPRDEFIKKFDDGVAEMAKDYKDSQGFYSVLEKTVDEKVGGKIDSISLSKMLDKNGVKQDELEWSGLKELMESKEKLSKEEIENTIKANRLEVVDKDGKELFQNQDAVVADSNQNPNVLYQAHKLEGSYLDRNGLIDTKRLEEHATDNLPSYVGEKEEFLKQFGNKDYVDTPIGRVDVDTEFHWDHINGENSGRQDRRFFGGTIEPTLRDPLFIVRDRDGSEIFFKPFKTDGGAFFVSSITKKYDGELLLETHYDPKLTKLSAWLRVPEKDFLYWKFGKGSKPPHGENKSSVGNAEIVPQNTQTVKGSVKGMFENYGDNGVITLFSNSDMTTVFHESAHYLETTFTKEERAAFDDAFGSHEAGRARSEAFAEGFVKWAATGEAKNSTIRSVFEKTREFLKEVLSSLMNSS